MPDAVSIRLARHADAEEIASLSRDLVECGLGWSWRPPRVVAAIRSPDDVAVVAERGARVAGAAVMSFSMDSVRLNLLVVRRAYQRSGVGRALVEWLEASALTAGTPQVSLEVRELRPDARAFYRRLGFVEMERLPGYYRGVESAIRMTRNLWVERRATRSG